MSQPTTVSGRQPAPGALRPLALYNGHVGKMLAGLAFLVATNLVALALPRLLNDAITLLQNGDATTTWVGRAFEGATAATAAYCIAGAAIAGGLVRVLSRTLIFDIGREVERDVRGHVFAHLSTLSPMAITKHSVGDLMSRMTNDLNNVRLLTGFAVLNVMNAAIMLGGTIPLLLSIDTTVALVALLPFPLVMVVTQGLSKQMYARVRKNQAALADLTNHVQENLAGAEVVRVFHREKQELEAFEKTNQNAYESALSLATLRLVMFPLTGMMGALGTAITIYVGGQAVVEGRITVGDFVEFNGRLLQLTWPAIALGFVISVYQRGRASLDRIGKLLDERPTVTDGTHRAAVEGGIEARGLEVRLPDVETPLLQDVHVSLEPGQVLGVVGKSGGGKSMLIRALSRQMAIADGQLSVDGVDVNAWHLADVHRGIGIVPDDGFLFSVSVRDNIAFARPDASDAEVAAVVELAGLTRDVNVWPEGLDTVVGERGVTLSGGQRQRVSLARALLAQPAVLLLDDALSAVDAETEAKIVGALRDGRLTGGRRPTLVIVSHRLSAVREADEIIALDAGRVVERGAHDALLAQDGLYAELWGKELLERKARGEVKA